MIQKEHKQVLGIKMAFPKAARRITARPSPPARRQLPVCFWQPNEASSTRDGGISEASAASGNFQNVLDKNDLLEAIHKSSK